MRQLSPFELREERKIYGLGGIYVIAFKNVLERVTAVTSESACWRMSEHCYSKTTGPPGTQRVRRAALRSPCSRH